MWKLLNNFSLKTGYKTTKYYNCYLLSFYERDRNYYLLNTKKYFLAYEMKGERETENFSRNRKHEINFSLIINLLRHKAILFLNHSKRSVAATSVYNKQNTLIQLHLFLECIGSFRVSRLVFWSAQDGSIIVAWGWWALIIKIIKNLVRLWRFLISSVSFGQRRFRIRYSFWEDLTFLWKSLMLMSPSYLGLHRDFAIIWFPFCHWLSLSSINSFPKHRLVNYLFSSSK